MGRLYDVDAQPRERVPVEREQPEDDQFDIGGKDGCLFDDPAAEEDE